MPAAKVDRISTFGPPPFCIIDRTLGPASTATVGPFPVGAIPVGSTSGIGTAAKRSISGVRVFASADVTGTANSTTFTVETAAGAVLATGTDVASFAKAAGLSLTVQSAAANLAAGTPLFIRIAGAASSTDFSAVQFVFQIETQP